MNKYTLIVLMFSNFYFSQKLLSIEEVTQRVLQDAIHVKIIENNHTKNIIQSNFYRKSILPKISANISLPYNRSISEVLQPDGSLKNLERNYLNSSLNLNLSQALPFTGGSISLSSNLNMARDFNFGTTNFSSSWVNVSYQQSINGFNEYKWNKKLNPLYKKQDSINYLKEKLKLKYDISKLFLDTYLTQLRFSLFKANIEKTKALLYELQTKLKLGRVLKIDVDQTKITLEQLHRQFEISKLEYYSNIQSLLDEMNARNTDSIVLQEVKIVDFEINKKQLFETVQKNKLDWEATLKTIEADAKVEKARKAGAISVSLSLGMGLNSSASEWDRLYQTPAQSQFITLSSKIPILDWGVAKDNFQIALLDKENTELALKEEEEKQKEQIDALFNYYVSLKYQIHSLQEQMKLTQAINEMFEELLKMGRKTISEYKTQLAETYAITMEYQKAVNSLYLLKLQIEQMNLTL